MVKNRCKAGGAKVKSKKKKACKAKTKDKAGTLYICEDCRRNSVRKDDLCTPEKASPLFQCRKCGSPALSKKSVCKPRKIRL